MKTFLAIVIISGTFAWACIQQNGSALRQLQKEAWDLELKRLEFRALRRN
jgi:hypothetical protein